MKLLDKLTYNQKASVVVQATGGKSKANVAFAKEILKIIKGHNCIYSCNDTCVAHLRAQAFNLLYGRILNEN